MNYKKYLKYKFRGGVYIEEEYNKLNNKWLHYYVGPITPTIVLRIGTMGSGKTSSINLFIDRELNYNSNLFSIIDLDRIVTTSGYMKTPEDWWEAQVTINGYKIVENIINESILLKRHLSTESTGKFLCPSKKIIRNAMHNGYNIIGICPFVPYFIIKNRIAKRAEEEGRNVSLKELIDNILNMLPNLIEIAIECDNFYVLNNTVSQDTTPEIIAHINYSITSRDNDKCCQWDINTNIINKLINYIKDNVNEYKTEIENTIYNEEIKFLEQFFKFKK